MTEIPKTLFALLILGTLLLGSTAQAAIDPERLFLAANGHIPWQSLSEEEKKALRDYRGRWNDLDTNRQQRIREGARRYRQLPPEQRRKIEQKQHEYEQLSPQEQRRLRKEYLRQHK